MSTANLLLANPYAMSKEVLIAGLEDAEKHKALSALIAVPIGSAVAGGSAALDGMRGGGDAFKLVTAGAAGIVAVASESAAPVVHKAAVETLKGALYSFIGIKAQEQGLRMHAERQAKLAKEREAGKAGKVAA